MGITESKIETTDRLRRQGKWVEASRFKEDVKQRHRDSGKSRQEANRLSWEAVQERFPAEDPPAIKTLDAALFRGIVDPPNSPQNREEITQIWLAFHLLQAMEIYRDLPTEEQAWARYRMKSTLHVLRDCVPSLAQFILALVEPSQLKLDAQAAFQRQLEIMDESDDESRYVEEALITLAMDTYGHLFPGQEADAVDQLRKMLVAPPEATRATGTDNAAVEDGQNQRSARRSAQNAKWCVQDAKRCT